MKFNKKFWVTAFTLAGTTIGAGILALPYIFSQSGFFIGVFWLIVLGFILLLVNLYLGEIALRTKTIHHLPGYAGKYLGKKGEVLMFITVAFGIYSALLAYLIGEGQSFSILFFGNLDYSIYFAVGFWFVMTLLLSQGLKELKKIELWGVLIIISIIFVIFFKFIPDVNVSNFVQYDLSNFFLPFGVIMFALLGFTSIPELRMEIKGQENLLKKAILVGALIPVILYVIFTYVFVGVLGKTVEQVATISFGNIIVILGIFTMLTSYFVLSFSLRDIFIFDFKKKKLVFYFVSLLPLFLYLAVSFFELADFVKILGIGGVISGGLAGILILLTNLKAKEKGNRNPEFSIPINWLIIGVLSLIFLAGIWFELF
ncbi:MAG: amino acid permease [Nanoarchaeota archaeon]|nr:amino acid permease [Nanoarchaeota archaeon]